MGGGWKRSRDDASCSFGQGAGHLFHWRGIRTGGFEARSKFGGHK